MRSLIHGGPQLLVVLTKRSAKSVNFARGYIASISRQPLRHTSTYDCTIGCMSEGKRFRVLAKYQMSPWGVAELPSSMVISDGSIFVG